MWQLNSNIIDYLPAWFRYVVELQAICNSESEQFEILAQQINDVADNFFFQTMDEGAVGMWEKVFNIVPNLENETLQFRQARLLNRISTRPPFTLGFLYQKLDSIIGKGQYQITIDYPNYTLYIASAAENQQWATEVSYTVGKIKPAHIVYINNPFLSDSIQISEEIKTGKTVWNYKLGAWGLGINPFASVVTDEVIITAGSGTVLQELLNGTAAQLNSVIKSARINGTVIVPVTVTVSENVATASYTVTNEQVTTINLLELLDSDNNPLTSAPVYIPVTDNVLLSHNIQVEEMVTNG